MMIPMWYTAFQVKRSHYPRTFTGLKDGEETSFENSQLCLVAITSCLCVFSMMEVVGYYIYLSIFHPWKNIIQKNEEKMSPKPELGTTSGKEEKEMANLTASTHQA